MAANNTPLGVSEAAEILGCGRTWVLHLIKTKRIRVEKMPGKTAPYLLSRADVRALADKKRKRETSAA